MSTQYGRRVLDIPAYAPTTDEAVTAAIHSDYLGFLGAVASHCGDIGSYQRSGQPIVLINSPDLVRELLIDRAGDTSKGELQRTAFRALLGESVSVSEGARHRMLRRLLAPLLTRRQVTGYADRIVRTAAVFCSEWPRAGTVDLFAELHRLTLHTLGRSLIAEDSLWDEQSQFWQCRQRLWDWITGHAGQGHHLTGAANPLTDKDFTPAITSIQNVLDHIIEDRASEVSPLTDLLSSLTTANKRAEYPLNQAQVRDQILALLFAAHETSACALFWSLYLLDHHPGARRRLECEVDTVFAAQPCTGALPYTLQVLKETMRLYPPAGRQFRVTARPISLGGHHVPEGTPVTVCQYLLHRRDTSFPEPERFDPQRFAPEASSRHPLAYLPLGAGERICLGRHYALLEAQLLLAYLVSNFRFQFPHTVPARLSVTVRPEDHTQAEIRRRHRSDSPG